MPRIDLAKAKKHQECDRVRPTSTSTARLTPKYIQAIYRPCALFSSVDLISTAKPCLLRFRTARSCASFSADSVTRLPTKGRANARRQHAQPRGVPAKRYHTTRCWRRALSRCSLLRGSPKIFQEDGMGEARRKRPIPASRCAEPTYFPVVNPLCCVSFPLSCVSCISTIY